MAGNIEVLLWHSGSSHYEELKRRLEIETKYSSMMRWQICVFSRKSREYQTRASKAAGMILNANPF